MLPLQGDESEEARLTGTPRWGFREEIQTGVLFGWFFRGPASWTAQRAVRLAMHEFHPLSPQG